MDADDPRHGTVAGALAHRRIGEKPCEPCREAHATYMRAYRTRPAAQKSTRLGNRARSRALWRLAALHPDEYRRIYADELRHGRQQNTNPEGRNQP